MCIFITFGNNEVNDDSDLLLCEAVRLFRLSLLHKIIVVRNIYLIFFFFFSLLVYYPTGTQGSNPFVSNDQAKKLLQNRPVQFVENKGQMTDMAGTPIPFVLFKAESPGMNVYITEKGLTYIFYKYAEGDESEREREEKNQKFPFNVKQPSEAEDKEDNALKWERIDMELKGALIRKENVFKEGASYEFSQYFLAHCPEGITDVHSFKKITIKNIYPNIDWLIYNAEGKGFKYDFIVHPGADPKQIKLVYSALNPLKKNKEGELKIKTGLGELNELAPYCYTREKNQKIESQFQILSQEKINKYYETVVSFKFTDFIISNSQTLVIDPQLTWATFLSGVDTQCPRSVFCDSSGNVFITGPNNQVNLPLNNPGGGVYYQGTLSGASTQDAMIAKFSNSGVLIWSTYYGGTGDDSGFAIHIAKGGYVCVTGYTTSTDFPTQNPGGGAFFQAANAGSYDPFILKFTNAGVRLWATYFGGPNFEMANGITSDTSGNIFLVGQGSSGIPIQTLAGAYNQSTTTSDAIFITKFNNSNALQWSTFVGGSGSHYGASIHVDKMGNIYIAGSTTSTDFPIQTLAGAYNQSSYGGGNQDAVILKFNILCALEWSTYFGGPGDYERGYSIKTDANQNVFVVGSVGSNGFPTLNPGGGAFFQGTFGGSSAVGATDIFISKFNSLGALTWSTYYGGNGGVGESFSSTNDALLVDNCGNIYTTFFTSSANLVSLDEGNGGYFQGTQYPIGITDWDGMILRFTNSGILTWATYFGGGAADDGQAIALDANNNLFMTGEWATYDNSTNPILPPLTNPGGGAYYNTTPAYENAGFIAKFSKMPLSVTTSNTNTDCGCIGTASVTNSTGGIAPYTYNWSNGQTTQTATGLCAGTVTVTVNDSLCSSQTQVLTISATGVFSIDTLSTPATCSYSSDGSATVTPSGGTAPYIYAWLPSGGTNSTASGLSIGTYTVSITDFTGCTQSKTIAITSSSSAITLTTSATANSSCTANGIATAVATGGSGVLTYLWSNGQSTSAATGLTGGTYTITVTDVNGCSKIDTANVASSAPSITLLFSTTTAGCIDTGTATVTASGGIAPYLYVWTNGSTTQTAVGLAAGTYSVTVTDSVGCSQNQSIVITGLTIPVVTATAQPALIIGQGTSQLSATGGVDYSWFPETGLSCADCPSPLATPLKTTIYCVSVTGANSCSDSACVTIQVEIPCESFIVPTAFSPNGDENSDVFIIPGLDYCVETYSFAIYDRWGEKVFETQNAATPWDGTYKGKPLDSAVFAYTMSLTLTGGKKIAKKGNISLIR